jgi:hypothetical protein
MFMIIQLGTLLKKKTPAKDVFLSNQVLLGLQWEVDYRRFNEAIKSPSRATTDLEGRVHLWLTEFKRHAYTMNTTSTQEWQGLKYSKESCKPEEQ